MYRNSIFIEMKRYSSYELSDLYPYILFSFKNIQIKGSIIYLSLVSSLFFELHPTKNILRVNNV